MRRLQYTSVALLLLGTLSGPVAANDDSNLRTQLARCQQIPSALRRLDCFDRLASDVGGPPPDGGLTTPPVATPDRSPPPRATDPSANRSVTSILARLEQRPRGERIFHLANGQIWTEIEPGRAHYETGSEVRIRRTLFGSYMLSVDGARATRVRRVE